MPLVFFLPRIDRYVPGQPAGISLSSRYPVFFFFKEIPTKKRREVKSTGFVLRREGEKRGEVRRVDAVFPSSSLSSSDRIIIAVPRTHRSVTRLDTPMNTHNEDDDDEEEKEEMEITWMAS